MAFTKSLGVLDVMERMLIVSYTIAHKMHYGSVVWSIKNVMGYRNVSECNSHVACQLRCVVHDMVQFAQDMQACRKVLFAR